MAVNSFRPSSGVDFHALLRKAAIEKRAKEKAEQEQQKQVILRFSHTRKNTFLFQTGRRKTPETNRSRERRLRKMVAG